MNPLGDANFKYYRSATEESNAREAFCTCARRLAMRKASMGLMMVAYFATVVGCLAAPVDNSGSSTNPGAPSPSVYPTYYIVAGAVHQWIALQAYLRLPAGDLKTELGNYLPTDPGDQLYGWYLSTAIIAPKWLDVLGFDNGDWCIDPATALIQGAYEEDAEDVINGTVDGGHFWNPDGEYTSAVEIDGTTYESALMEAQTAFTNAVESYPSDKAKAYYWLGRTSHLLMDMSVPAHVLLDLHSATSLTNDDAYEDNTASLYKDVTWASTNTDIPAVAALEAFPRYTPSTYDGNLTKLFYGLAEYARQFDSDDVNGTSATYGGGKYRNISGDISNEVIQTVYQPQLQTRAIGYSAALFQLFWDKVHSLTNIGTRIIGLEGNLAFGNVTTGQTLMATLVITNSGNSVLTVTNISYPSGFSGTWSGTITAGTATNVTVTFAPTSVTSYGGDLTVNCDYTAGTNTVAVTGTGTTANIFVTVQPGLSGPSFTVDGTSYTVAQIFSWVSGSSHTIAASSPQSGGTGIQYVWSSWSDSGAMSHTVAPAVDTTYTANFTTQYNLTMNMGTGGSSVSPSSGWQNSGAVVPISATTARGYSFSGWTASGSGSYSGSSSSSSVTMNGPITETANFTDNASPTLSVAPNNQPVNFTVGTTTFAVSNTGGGTMSYTASESVSWLSITSGSSGGNSGTITVSYDANNGTTVRTGTITVTASGAIGSPKSVALIQAGMVVPPANISHMSSSQRCYFTYSASSYYGFIYDYSAGIQESVTPGFISYNTSLNWNAQAVPAAGMTTHVAYIYNTNVGRYTEAMAFLDQSL